MVFYKGNDGVGVYILSKRKGFISIGTNLEHGTFYPNNFPRIYREENVDF